MAGSTKVLDKGLMEIGLKVEIKDKPTAAVLVYRLF